MPVCSNCGHKGTGKFCAECGQAFIVKRVTLLSILNEVIHTFTHFDKGFGYTLKELIFHPGTMQKNYLAGQRKNYQKPFSMLFICATLAGLAIYWISRPAHLNVTPFEEMREHFYRHYFVIFQSVMTPFYALITWIAFRKKNFNYAEALILFVYSLAFLLLLTILTNAIDLIPHRFETYYIEIPLMTAYFIWTNLNFFNTSSKWLVILKSIIILLAGWITSNLATTQVIHLMMQ
ncbi:MAG: hypothetical protein B6D37_12340 [Sphingobacteriales bacterium UTBCD1]|jgi:hypothetical protein|nr:MAG: hypothetical protein B6D37_12340 [Sphingobacteriales bacterium UTBCD1]